MNSRILLVASLIANLALAAILLRRTPPGPSDPAAPPPASSPTLPSRAPKTAQVPNPDSHAVTPTAPRRFTWEQVESADYREYIQNLRAIGCPEETIRDIILADVGKLYDAKRKQARGGPKKFEYWKAGNPLVAMLGDPETTKKMTALEEEKAKVLRDLGIQPDAKSEMLAMAGGNAMDSMFDFLSESKRVEVTKLMTEHQSKMAESMKDGAPDGETIMKMQRGMEDALREKLTPEEFLDYQLRFGMTANLLRSQITGFDPSEEEFMKVFKLKDAFDQEFSQFGAANETEAEQRKRAEATTELNGRLRETLGPERYADYERAQDYSYQQLYQIAKKAELAPAVANEAHAMKRAPGQRAAGIRPDAPLHPQQRVAALAAVRAETERSFAQTLGDKGWEQYNRPNNTWWLRTIAPNASQDPPAVRTTVHDTIIVAPTP